MSSRTSTPQAPMPRTSTTAALDELAMGCEALQQAQQGATGTVSGGSGDSFGMIAVGAGAGALVGGGAIYALMRRRASQAEQKA